MKRPSVKKYNLVVVAHPDDETIFFGGLLQAYRRKPWKVICATDGNADGMGVQRRQDFQRACDALKVQNSEMWDFPDRFENRLDIDKLAERLKHENAAEIFTHGVLGEYGHPHHQDVCLAVHRAFSPKKKVWSVAYNCFAEKVFRLRRKDFERKSEVLSRIYFSETQRFARWLPVTNYEGFAQIDLKEIEALYAFFARGEKPREAQLKAYSWFRPYLEDFRDQVNARPF